MCRCITDLGVKDMIINNTKFIEVVADEYKTMFDFYANQLQFKYVKGNLVQMQQCMDELNTRNETYQIIEGLKCGNDYVLYIGEHSTETIVII